MRGLGFGAEDLVLDCFGASCVGSIVAKVMPVWILLLATWVLAGVPWRMCGKPGGRT